MSREGISAPVRIGVVGTGGMGSAHCRCLPAIAEARLTAVCDIDPDIAENIGRECGVPHFCHHVDLLASGLCDAVIVATPHPFHPTIAIAAMRAGLHVLSEKPLAERISTAEAMVDTSRETGMALAIMFQRRLEPAFARALAIARSGQLGKIYRTTLISPEYRSQAYYDSGGWRATWAGEGGGVMTNQSPHILDMFIQLGGRPASVFGRTETRLHHIEVEDIAEAMLTYADGGSGYLYCSTNEAGPGQMIEIFGDCGKLCYRNGDLSLHCFASPISEHVRTSTSMWGGPEIVPEALTLEEHPCGHDQVIRNFARHLLYDEPLIAPGEQGLASVELANAVWLSASRQAPVSLPLDRAAYDAFLEEKCATSTFVKQVASGKAETDPRLLEGGTLKAF